MSLGFSALLAASASQQNTNSLVQALLWQWPIMAGVLLGLIVWGAWLLRQSATEQKNRG